MLRQTVTERKPALDDQTPSVSRPEVGNRRGVLHHSVDLDRPVQARAVAAAKEEELAGLHLDRREAVPDDIVKLMAKYGFRPYTVVNKYTAEFYLDALQKGVPKAVQLQDGIAEHMDVIFSREAFV